MFGAQSYVVIFGILAITLIQQFTCGDYNYYSSWIKVLVLNVNTLRPGQNGRHFADDIFKCVLLNENVWITINKSLKFVPKGPINNIPELFQIMASHRPGDKPLSEPMLVSLPTHICVTRPQWVHRDMYLGKYNLTEI